MRSVKIQLVSPQSIIRRTFCWKMTPLLLAITIGVFSLPFLLMPFGGTFFTVIFISCAAIVSLVAHTIFSRKRAIEFVQEIEHTFDEQGFYAVPMVRVGVPMLKVNGALYHLDTPEKLLVPWDSSFTQLWQSKRFTYLTGKAKTGERCDIIFPRRELIANYDEIIAFLKALPNVSKTIFAALE
jgi:hypothetical protein